MFFRELIILGHEPFDHFILAVNLEVLIEAVCAELSYSSVIDFYMPPSIGKKFRIGELSLILIEYVPLAFSPSESSLSSKTSSRSSDWTSPYSASQLSNISSEIL